jgi:hypothetical protein
MAYTTFLAAILTLIYLQVGSLPSQIGRMAPGAAPKAPNGQP